MRRDAMQYSLLAQYHNTLLLPSKKNCIGIVSDFPWDIFMSQEKLQTMIMQNFGGLKEVYYGICASREFGNLYLGDKNQPILFLSRISSVVS